MSYNFDIADEVERVKEIGFLRRKKHSIEKKIRKLQKELERHMHR